MLKTLSLLETFAYILCIISAFYLCAVCINFQRSSRTFYVRKLRNREGKLLYTSDESSADETLPDEAKCPLIISDDDDDDVVAKDKVSLYSYLQH